MYLMPDLDTFAVIPWEMDLSTARVICDVYTPDGAPFEGDPRYVLKRQLDARRSWGSTTRSGRNWSSSSSNATPMASLLPLTPHDEAGYFDISTDLAHSVRRQMVDALQSHGHRRRSVAPRGRRTARARSTSAMARRSATADNAITFRTTLKAVAQKNGLHCTFMPKPHRRRQRLRHARASEPVASADRRHRHV